MTAGYCKQPSLPGYPSRRTHGVKRHNLGTTIRYVLPMYAFGYFDGDRSFGVSAVTS